MRNHFKITFSSLVISFLFCNYSYANEPFNEATPLVSKSACEIVSNSSNSNAKYLSKEEVAFIGSVNLATIVMRNISPGLQKEWREMGAGCDLGKLQTNSVPSEYDLVYREAKGFSIEFGGDINNSIALIYGDGNKTNTKDRYYYLIKLSKNEGKLLAAYSQLPALDQVKADLIKAMENNFKPMISAKLNDRTQEIEIKYK